MHRQGRHSAWRAITACAMLFATQVLAAPFIYVGSGQQGTLTVIDQASWSTLLSRQSGTSPYTFAHSRSDGRIYIVSQLTNAPILALSTQTHQTVRTYTGIGGLYGVAVSPDGSRLYASAYPAPYLRVIDTSTGTLLSSVLVGNQPHGVAVSPDGSRILVANSSSGTVSVIDAQSLQVIATVHYGSVPESVAFSADGRLGFVTLFTSGQLALLDMDTLSAGGRVGTGSGANSLAVAPDGSRVYVTNWTADTVSAIDTNTYSVQNIAMGAGSRPSGISVSADGGTVYVTRFNSADLRRIDAATLTLDPVAIPVGPAPFNLGVFTSGYTTPTAPQLLEVNPKGSNLSLVFQPPLNDGGQPISHYSASCGAFQTQGPASPLQLSGLPLNQPLACSVQAHNAVGASTASNIIEVQLGSVPGPPLQLSGSAGDRQIVLQFQPPASDGGLPISEYLAICNSSSVAGSASPLQLDGLVNGQTYSCSVRARNAIGLGLASETVQLTPRTVPATPVITQIEVYNQQLVVNFTLASNGGSPVLSVQGQCDEHLASAGAGATALSFTGLENGRTYSCSVGASNAVGPSALSAPVSGTPAGPPDAPTLLAIHPGDRSATFEFVPPVNSNGAPVTRYQVICLDGGPFVTGSASPIVLSGMSNGTAYRCGVNAGNVSGNSGISNTLWVTPATVPQAPQLLALEHGDGLLRLLFQPPTDNGGAAVQTYLARCGDQTAEAGGSPIEVPGLLNGQSYTCTVAARNSAGLGAVSGSAQGTPRTVPGAPQALLATALPSGMRMEFQPPLSDGGASILGYQLLCQPGALHSTGSASPLELQGLQANLLYRCSVHARNSEGDGIPAAAVSVIPGEFGNTTDLSISKTNSSSYVPGGQRTGYLIEVHNQGPAPVVGARVLDVLEPYFSDAQWQCSSSNGAHCPPLGSGVELDMLVDLPAGSSVQIQLSAVLAPLPEDPVFNVVGVSVPASLSDTDPSNNTASDGPDIRGVFRDGFE